MTTTPNLPYGPGKFSTVLDAYVYDVSLDGGCDEETGDAGSLGGWYGLLRGGRSIFRDHDPFLEPLTEDERSVLESAAGAILNETSDGFVSVSYYDRPADLDAAWSQILSIEEPDRD